MYVGSGNGPECTTNISILHLNCNSYGKIPKRHYFLDDYGYLYML